LIDSFTPEQRERHEMFVRSKFNKANMKNVRSSENRKGRGSRCRAAAPNVVDFHSRIPVFSHTPSSLTHQLMQNILGYPVDDTTRFVMSSLAKVYVGEVVEMGGLMVRAFGRGTDSDNRRKQFPRYPHLSDQR
jgi:hypothetical protein